MTTDHLQEQPHDIKPPRKTKWYWSVFILICTLGLFGGVEIFLFRDISLLLYLVAVIWLITFLADYWLVKPQKRWIALKNFTWYFGAVLGIYLVLLFTIPPFAISPQTTYLTEPRSQEFYGIDYAVVIKRQLDPGALPEENGFRLLIETLGKPFFCENIADKHWNRLCQYLNLPTAIEPKLTFVDWQTYEKTLNPEEQEIAYRRFMGEGIAPCSEEEIPIVKRWLDENDATLDLFVAAADKPVLYIPPMFDGQLFETLLYNDQICRKMVSNLKIRGHYRLTIGEIDKAWDDVLTMYRLAEQQRLAVWNVMTSLSYFSIMEEMNRFAESVMLHSGWTPDEIRRKGEEIVPYQRPLREEDIRGVLRNERLTMLDSIQHLHEAIPAQDFWGWFKQKNFEMSLRRGYIMVEVNERFDEMEQLFLSDTPIPDIQEKPDFFQLLFQYGKIRAIPIMIGRMKSSGMFSSVVAWQTSPKRHQANIALHRTMFALEAYRQENDGNYPDKLDDLPEEIPLDPFSSNPANEPFRYLMEPSGYLLYSVGPNGVDEDGRDYNDFPKGDDIRRRMPQFH